MVAFSARFFSHFYRFLAFWEVMWLLATHFCISKAKQWLKSDEKAPRFIRAQNALD